MIVILEVENGMVKGKIIKKAVPSSGDTQERYAEEEFCAEASDFGRFVFHDVEDIVITYANCNYRIIK